jgi:UDP-glucose 4-epimerase
MDHKLNFSGKTILIAGGTGSLGKALTNRLRKANKVVIFSRDELKQWTMRNELQDNNVQFFVGDIRDPQRVEDVLIATNPHVVIIAAALKQVDTCEYAPSESIKTNISGVQNIVESTERNLHRLDNLECVVMVSTDKACAPTNVYGMSKAIAERIVTSRSVVNKQVKYVVVRYGNVLESRGSIIPLFHYQAKNSPAFTLTHECMTRFIMTLEDSIDLILTAALRGKSGTTWLPRLRAMRIVDLANIFSRRFQKPVSVIGMRPGEKMHEALISEAESVRVTKENDFYVMQPSFAPVSQDAHMFEYSSDQDLLTPEALEDYLASLGIFDASIDDFKGPRIETIRETDR